MPVSEVGTPSNEGWHPPPMGNPGSAPGIDRHQPQAKYLGTKSIREKFIIDHLRSKQKHQFYLGTEIEELGILTEIDVEPGVQLQVLRNLRFKKK